MEDLDEEDFVEVEEDKVLKELREIVGVDWATNDPPLSSGLIPYPLFLKAPQVCITWLCPIFSQQVA